MNSGLAWLIVVVGAIVVAAVFALTLVLLVLLTIGRFRAPRVKERQEFDLESFNESGFMLALGSGDIRSKTEEPE